jgi:hypothetical protein
MTPAQLRPARQLAAKIMELGRRLHGGGRHDCYVRRVVGLAQIDRQIRHLPCQLRGSLGHD